MASLLLVFVHGYSVTNLDTYGELPLRLRNEALARGIEARIENIFLGRYISFNDEVRLDDVSRAMHLAVQEQIPKNMRFVCITHSTGGPVVRNWHHLFYENQTAVCPMSHLIMLAPANNGSALAQLGKTKLSRVKSWFDGVEPGQKILDWLELGSSQAWDLNKNWIVNGDKEISEQGIFPFVLTGQDIDRKLYDHINSYTGELGSDGVVRVASANLNSNYISLRQQTPVSSGTRIAAISLEVERTKEAPQTAMRIISQKSHSGDKMGIMRSVLQETSDQHNAETVKAIFDCMEVRSTADYLKVCELFSAETNQLQKDFLIETEKKLLKTTIYIHDRYCMVIFRIKDSEGYALTNFDLVLTGPNDDPDMLPSGFFADRQSNKNNPSILTYYFNYDVMVGAPAVVKDGEEIRKALPGIDSLGLIISPRPDEGFVRYLPCKLSATRELFEKAIKPNATTLIEIQLQRIVSTETFRFENPEPDKLTERSFKNTDPGNGILG
ncbi:phospholipase [Sphingobacteriaceae bacterium]|nr:phospholipase [Sphingobacteriaceae bacterium]